MRIVIAPSNVTLPMPCTKPRAVRLMTATLGKVHAGEARGRDEGWVRSRWCDSDAGGVVAVPAVLARPLASPVAQGDFVGNRSRDPRGGEWCGRALGEPRAASPSAAVPAGQKLPRRGSAAGPSCLPLASHHPQRSSTAPGCSAGCPSTRVAALAVPTRRGGCLGAGRPSPWLRPAPEADARSGPTQRTLWRSSSTRFGAGPSVGPPSTKNGTRYPAVTARRPARCPGRARAPGCVRGAWPSLDAGPATGQLGRFDLPMSRLVREGYDGLARRERQGIKGGFHGSSPAGRSGGRRPAAGRSACLRPAAGHRDHRPEEPGRDLRGCRPQLRRGRAALHHHHHQQPGRAHHHLRRRPHPCHLHPDR